MSEPSESIASILVVHDTTYLAQIIKDIVELEGLLARFTNNGREAIDLLNEGTFIPDLIISNYQMPYINGLELLVYIRQSQQFREVAFILTSATTFRRIRQGARQHGICLGHEQFIGEPFDPYDLLYSIADTLALQYDPSKGFLNSLDDLVEF